MEPAEILGVVTTRNKPSLPKRMKFPQEGKWQRRLEEAAARAGRRKESLARDGRAATVGAIEAIRSERALRRAATEETDASRHDEDREQPREASSS